MKERPVPDLLADLRKTTAAEHEVALLEFLELPEHEQREFLFRALVRITQWVSLLKQRQGSA